LGEVSNVDELLGAIIMILFIFGMGFFIFEAIDSPETDIEAEINTTIPVSHTYDYDYKPEPIENDDSSREGLIKFFLFVCLIGFGILYFIIKNWKHIVEVLVGK